MPVLTRAQLAEFATRGYLVLPGVVPPAVVAAASGAIDELTERDPPVPGTRGPHHYFRPATSWPALTALLTGSPGFGLAEALTGPGTLETPDQVQVALNIPPFPHRPGRPHIDGYPPDASGRPGTFTLLAGVLMSGQPGPDAGNLWVWPGSHLAHAAYFRAHGPDAFAAAAGYPPVDLPEPGQVTGRAGDLVLAHYLLGHNIGGNTSPAVRRAVYFRVKRAGHDLRWQEFLRDPWLDFDGPALGGNTSAGNLVVSKQLNHRRWSRWLPTRQGRIAPQVCRPGRNRTCRPHHLIRSTRRRPTPRTTATLSTRLDAMRESGRAISGSRCPTPRWAC